VSRATGAPVIGVGGVSTGEDALQYIMAGASAVGVGTAALRDPRAPERIVTELEAWMERLGARTLDEVRGSLQWPK
jgi:dihydroorotate dehydrogenase (NAD+) catalytic subunit